MEKSQWIKLPEILVRKKKNQNSNTVTKQMKTLHVFDGQ